MIKFEKPAIYGFDAAIRGMRNSWNSWDKSDSYDRRNYRNQADFEADKCRGVIGKNCDWETSQKNPLIYGNIFGCGLWCEYVIGPNDLALMKKLVAAGSDHRKFLRMIVVTVDITAPLYWWKEFDTYKVGTVANSCSTMHKIPDKEFSLDDFSREQLWSVATLHLMDTIKLLNTWRDAYNNPNSCDTYKKQCWWQMIQLLPSSYNQKRTVMLNYEVLRNMYHARREHRLDEWRTLCQWVETLPYSELITGVKNNG